LPSSSHVKKRNNTAEEPAGKKTAPEKPQLTGALKEANSMWVLHANLNGYKTHGIDVEIEIETTTKKT